MAKYLFMDSETAETNVVNGQLDVSNGQVYDLGLMVIDENGKVYDQISMVNEDVFFGMPESMQNAYYADKIPQYLEDMRMGKRKIVNSWQMYKIFKEMLQKYDISAVVAHNAFFDVNVLNSTMRYQTKSCKRWFVPWGYTIIDTLKLARNTFGKDPDYIEWCKANDYMTKHEVPRPRLTAEILYRYITGNNDYVESHTGLEDVTIEKEIFLKCMAKMGE
jgi:hypothetical protein